MNEFYPGTGVTVKDGTSIEYALKKFKKKIKNSGILIDYKKYMFFEKPSSKKRRERELSKLRKLKAQKDSI